ncbi:MAG: hypothetical protein RL318_3110 [Fibrobacterota bacterium]|jgi:DNA-binding NarL/FixJ family response regulator
MTCFPNILLADDHAAIRMGVRALALYLWPSARVVEVSDGLALAKELSARAWDLVVLDQSMPGCSGLEALTSLAVRPKVLVYTMHDSPEVVRKARDAGALGLVTKASGPGLLEHALVAVMAGDPCFPEEVGSELDQLSQREREVLDALLEGLGPKDIAVRLCVTPSSVQTHIARLLTKLDLKSTRDLFRWAAVRGRLE